MSLHIGQRLGQYRLVQLLGQGGFAQVYLGEHVRLNTQVAIKVLSGAIAGNAIAGLFAEARTIARLEHPHIVRLLDFDVEENISFLVMSYAAQGTLRHRYPRGSILTPDTILTYLKQAAAALQYAHDERVIHRDIKPENMLLDRRGKLLLSDFGVAAIAHSSRSMHTQEIAGTVTYMAPEQLQGKPRPASDQYALAVIVYEWLCGSPPFRGTAPEIVAQHLSTPPPPPREKLPHIPAALESVLLRALEKNPQQRFASISEFASAFEQAALQPCLPENRRMEQTPQLFLTSSSEYPTAPATPARSANAHSTRQRHISRRALLIGAPLLIGAGTGAGITRLTLSSQLDKQPLHATTHTLVVYYGHTDTVRAVAWSPNGSRIASSADLIDHTVQLWDATTGAHPFIYRRYTTTISAVAWSPDGTRVACGGGNGLFGGIHTVQVWEAASGKLLTTYSGHQQPVLSLAWSPDGTRIASASQDKTVQIWDPASGTRIISYTRHNAPVSAVAWSPDGSLIASASQDTSAQLWDPRTATPILSIAHNNAVSALAWSPDGSRLVTGEGNILLGGEHLAHVWNAKSGQLLLTYSKHASALTSTAWSPDGKHIVSASYDKPVRVWDATTGATIFTYHGHTLGVTSAAWSPDGRLIATGSLDGTVRVWKTS